MAVRDPYPEMVICDRSLNRQTSDYTYAQIPYKERLAFPHICEVYTSSVLRCYTPKLFCVWVCVCARRP